MKLLSQLTNVQGQTVLIRAGFDLPIENGVVTDTSRIRSVLPTIRFILDGGGTVVLLAHQGRPTEAMEPEFSQQPLVKVLEDLLHMPVEFCSDFVSSTPTVTSGSVLLCENLRYFAAETSKDANVRKEFAAKMAAMGTMYVNEAFTNCHRNHASMVELATLLPAYAGLSLEQEVHHLSALHSPEAPVVCIVAGAKIETKVPVIRQFLQSADYILTGGVIANTFLAAQGHALGQSRIDADALEVAKELLDLSKSSRAKIIVPTDATVADDIQGTALRNESVPFTNGMAFDIGIETRKLYSTYVHSAKTIIWNGPVGMYEEEAYRAGSASIADAVVTATNKGARSVIGGGDTNDLLTLLHIPFTACTFVSMGGGAMLSFLAKEPMPGLQVLE